MPLDGVHPWWIKSQKKFFNLRMSNGWAIASQIHPHHQHEETNLFCKKKEIQSVLRVKETAVDKLPVVIWTSKQVLSTPFAGRNRLSDAKTTFSISNGTKKTKNQRKADQSLYSFKKLNLTSEQHAEHPFAGQNTQQLPPFLEDFMPTLKHFVI